MQLLDGKTAAQAIKEKLRLETEAYTQKAGRKPHLAAVLVGSNGASETYVSSKISNCEAVGFRSSLIRFEESISEQELLHTIGRLNADSDIDGILVQLPLPKHISSDKVIQHIDPSKDVDGFHPVNAGKLLLGLPAFVPATPLGILLLLEHYQVPTEGKHAVVIGRSNIVGRPMSILLSQNKYPGNCTVTLCHSRSENLAAFSREADIVVAALGIPRFLKSDMVKEGAVVIDVGITRVPDSSKKSGFAIRGDVDFESVAPRCSFITPVPGGVGLMTIAALLTNTLNAAKSKVPTS